MSYQKAKTPFDLAFDPTTQPGYQTRNVSLDKFTGGAGVAVKVSNQPQTVTAPLRKIDLRKHFGSGQVTQLLPSRIQKFKGV